MQFLGSRMQSKIKMRMASSSSKGRKHSSNKQLLIAARKALIITVFLSHASSASLLFCGAIKRINVKDVGGEEGREK